MNPTLSSQPAATPLAQDFTVACRRPSPDHFIHDPGMTVLPGGGIFVAAPAWTRGGGPRQVLLSRSSDGGRRWEELPALPYAEATPFVLDNTLYMFTQPDQHRDVHFIRSEDHGESWCEPSRVTEGAYWNCQTGMVVTEDTLYWAFDERLQAVLAAAADRSKDLLDPAAWRISNVVSRASAPKEVVRGLNPPGSERWPWQWANDVWLEPNVVCVNGHLRVLLRAVIDEYATANLCAVCDLTDDGTDLALEFTQYYPLPGGQNKFCIVSDEPSRLFWMASNLVTDSQDHLNRRDALVASGFMGGPGNERRLLFLFYSVDALNWIPAGCIAMWPKMTQSFMYPAMLVDGDDLVLLSRTSENAANQHDADLATFHRVRDFRRLALNLYPEALG